MLGSTFHDKEALMTLGKIGSTDIMHHGFTAKSYVQEGLVALYDCAENAGWGVHDSNAAVWKELVNGWDLPMPSGTIWNEDSVGPLNSDKNGYFGKASKQEMSVAIAANNAAAFEISFLKTGDTISPQWHTSVGQGPNFYLRFLNNQVAMYNIGGMTGAGSYFYNFRLSKNVFHTLVLNMESGKKCQVYADGIKVDESRNVGNFDISLWKTGNYQQKWSFGAEKQYCCRIYNRNLTPAEISANHEIDVARFNPNGGGCISA